jgi:hypothetical protein
MTRIDAALSPIAAILILTQLLECFDIGEVLRAAARALVLDEMLSRENENVLNAQEEGSRALDAQRLLESIERRFVTFATDRARQRASVSRARSRSMETLLLMMQRPGVAPAIRPAGLFRPAERGSGRRLHGAPSRNTVDDLRLPGAASRNTVPNSGSAEPPRGTRFRTPAPWCRTSAPSLRTLEHHRAANFGGNVLTRRVLSFRAAAEVPSRTTESPGSSVGRAED